jgi:hypothetical protein
MGQIMTLMGSHPRFAGGNLSFDTSDLAPFAAQYRVTEDEVAAQILNHPVLGPIVDSAQAVAREKSLDSKTRVSDNSEVAADDGWATDDDWADDFSLVFVDQALADAHTGPWGDHGLGRCDSSDRSVQPVDTWFSSGGSTQGDALVDGSVTLGAVFEPEKAARRAFDEIDICHVPASVNQFLQALGLSDLMVNSLGFQSYDNDGNPQILGADYLEQDLPLGFVAIQAGDTVIITINFGYGIDDAVEEALINLG